MATKYYAVLTNVGAAKLANATALGAQVEITQMAVGDGNGVLPTPNPAQTALVHELRRKPLNSLSIDPNNANQIIAEQVIPEDEGGWWIREIGLFDKDGDMIAVANCAETYKPQLQEGSGRVQVVRMILIVSSTAAVTLKIDPSVVLATRQYVDDQIIQVKSYVDQKMAAHVAAADPHKQYAPKESPALTGRPTAPTAEGKDSSTQIANTAFVQAAIAALVGSSPEALDTLNELAAALGNDPNFATTVTNSLAGKMDKSANGSDIENVSVFLQNLRIGEIYAPLKDPSFIGTPTVPDAEQDEIDFRIANTAFVAQAIADLNGGAPVALNTLKELALAINNDANFHITVSNAIGQKAAQSDFAYSKTSLSVVGNQPGGLRFMCGETSAPTDANGNIFIALPDTFLNRVVYTEAHQSRGSYTADVDPFIFSSYSASNGPTSTISFAVRNSKTGVPLINSAISLQYFVKGY